MIYRCFSCGAATRYDTRSGKMVCDSCCSFWDPALIQKQAIQQEEEESALSPEPSQNRSFFSTADTMECPVYHCTACGARLWINEVESATYCAYCGQPAILFDRVSQLKKPDYLIPFRVSRSLAIEKVKSHLAGGTFVPVPLKHITPEHIRGIYIPYKLIDLTYRDVQVYVDSVSQKTGTAKRYLREGIARFRNLTLDTSISLNDESSRRLEPFEMIDLKPFQPVYLSGFYADCTDEDPFLTKKKAIQRGRALFTDRMKQQIKKESGGKPILLTEDPDVSIEKMADILLPAWFFVFQHQNKRYTIMVNGQTGKVVGAVPTDYKKAFLCFLPLTAICTALIYVLFSALAQAVPNQTARLFETILLLGIMTWANATLLWKNYQKSQDLTTDFQMQDYAVMRTDGEKGDSHL